MLRFMADENFDNRILRGLLRQKPNIDVVRAQDMGLAGAPDTEVLNHAACENRILLTHDVRTMNRYAYERVRTGQPMPGVLSVSPNIAIGQAVEELLLILNTTVAKEWEGQVWYIPM